jgi:phage-related protein
MNEENLQEVVETLKKQNTPADPRIKIARENKQIQEESLENQISQIDILQGISNQLSMIHDIMTDRFGDMVGSLERNRLQELENKQEERRRNEKLTKALTGINQSLDEGEGNYFKDLAEKVGDLLSPVLDILRTVVAIPAFTAIAITNFGIGFNAGMARLVTFGSTLAERINALATRIRTLFSFISRQFLILFPQVEVYFDSIRFFLTDQIRSIRMFMSRTFGGIGKSVSDMGRTVRAVVTNVFSTVTRVFQSIRTTVSTIFQTFRRLLTPVTALVRSTGSVIGGFFSRLRELYLRFGQIIGVFDEAGRLVGLVGKIANTIASAARTLGKFVPFLNVIIGAFFAVTGFLKGFEGDKSLIGRLQGALNSLWEGFFGSIINLIGSAVNSVLSFFGLDVLGDTIQNIASTLTTSISDSLVGAIDLVAGIFTLDISRIAEGLMSLGRGILSLLMTPIDLIWGLIKQVMSFFGVNIDMSVFDLIKAGVNALLAPFKLIGNAVMGVVGTVMSLLDPIFSVIGSLVDAVSRAGQWVNEKVDKYLGWIPGIGSSRDERQAEEAEALRNERQASDYLRQIQNAGAVGRDQQGALLTGTSTRNGVLDVPASEQLIRERGGTVLSQEAREQEEQYAQEVVRERRRRIEELRAQEAERVKFSDVVSTFSSTVDSIVKAPVNFFNNAKDWVSDNINFSETIRNFSLANVITAMSMAPVTLIQNAKDWVISKLGFDPEQMPTVADIVGNLISTPVQTIKDVTGWVISKLGFDPEQMPTVADIVGNLISTPVQTIKDVTGWVISKFGFSEEDGSALPLSGLISNLIAAPYDMVLSAGSWILSKLGFDSASEFLDGLSVKSLVSSIVDSVWGLFITAKDTIMDLFSGVSITGTIGAVVDIGKQFMKSMLRMILPDPGSDYGVFDPRRYISAAIPDKIYEFAGLDPKTGEVIPSQRVGEVADAANINIQRGTPSTASSALQREAAERAETEAAVRSTNMGAAGTAGAGGSGSTVNSTQIQQTNNNMTKVTPRPPAFEEPDNAADTQMAKGRFSYGP